MKYRNAKKNFKIRDVKSDVVNSSRSDYILGQFFQVKKENSIDIPPGGALDSELTPETKRNFRLSSISLYCHYQ